MFPPKSISITKPPTQIPHGSYLGHFTTPTVGDRPSESCNSAVAIRHTAKGKQQLWFSQSLTSCVAEIHTNTKDGDSLAKTRLVELV
jgi:hypothetical protein